MIEVRSIVHLARGKTGGDGLLQRLQGAIHIAKVVVDQRGAELHLGAAGSSDNAFCREAMASGLLSVMA